jgi:hypothetical protein
MRSPFEFVLALLAMCFLFSLIGTWLRQRGKTAHDKAADGVHVELLARLAEAEERIRVLERIVTDERYDLKRQIDELGR